MSQATNAQGSESQQTTNAQQANKVSDLSPDEFKALLRECLEGLPSATGAATADALALRSETSTVTGTVALDPAQWSTLSRFAGAGLHTSVFGVAFSALLLGAVVGVGLLMHWRGGRG